MRPPQFYEISCCRQLSDTRGDPDAGQQCGQGRGRTPGLRGVRQDHDGEVANNHG